MEVGAAGHGAAVTWALMFEDESVEVCHANGTRLQLSPCGCEFMVAKASDPSGRRERLRQRTRFAISAHQEVLLNALTFRNKHASQPYLPEELVPACRKKPCYSVNLAVKWPESPGCGAERGPGGETIIRSEEGRAALMLSPSGEEFSVEFICHLSQPRGVEGFRSAGRQHEATPIKTKEDCEGLRFGSPKITRASEPKPELLCQSTTVVQHHSCRSAHPLWSYPLSLARRVWSTCFSKAETDAGAAQRKTERPQSTEREAGLPRALPLTCSSPHWHRWRVKDSLVQRQLLDQELPTELVKVMWSDGITYRILSGSVPVVEISPGDGSVIQSNGILSAYFTHHKPDVTSRQVKEVTYHLQNLPPAVPGQPYSVSVVLRQASRLLTCYNQTKQSVRLAATPNCLQEDGYLCEVKSPENHCSLSSVEPQMSIAQTSDSRSDLVAAELEKIKRLNSVFDGHQPSDGKRRDDEMTGSGSGGGGATSEDVIAEALRRTSRALRDIETLTHSLT